MQHPLPGLRHNRSPEAYILLVTHEYLRGGEGWGESGNGVLYTSLPGIQLRKRCV